MPIDISKELDASTRIHRQRRLVDRVGLVYYTLHVSSHLWRRDDMVVVVVPVENGLYMFVLLSLYMCHYAFS